MAFTKIVGAGIHTLSNVHTHNINSSGIITATSFVGPLDGTNGDFSGNVTINGNLIVNGDTTTLNTTLREVEILRVDANNSTVGAAITQSGTGDILNLYDGSTEIFSVEDGGKVKIGMGALGTNASDYDAAANNLIVGTGSGDEGITILSGQSVGHHGSIFFADGTGATNSKRGQIRYEQNSEIMKFFTAGTQKLTIDLNGKVGIGSEIPAVLLDVQGHAGSGAQHTIRSKSTAANASNFVRSESSDGLYIGLLKYGTGHSAYGALPAGGGAVYANSSVPITIMSDGGSGYINFATGGNTERLRISSVGELTSTAAQANVATFTSNQTASTIYVKDTDGDGIFISGSSAYGHRIYTNTTEDLLLGTNSAEKLRIKNDGKVGIGTNDPESLLHISNLSGATEMIVTSSTQPRLMLKTTGTSAECRVDFGDSGDSSRGAIGYNHTDDALKFYTSGVANERLRITSTGSVGIGTNNPDVGNTAYPVVQVHGTSTNAYFKLTNTTTGVGSGDGVELSLSGSDAYLTNRESANIIFRTGGSNERVRIESDGQVQIGSGTIKGGGHLTIRGGGVNTYACQDYQYVGTPSNNTTTLAQIRFTANTTGASVVQGAKIQAVSDAAWSATGDAPTRLEFHTVPDNSASMVNRMTIGSSGKILMGVAANNGASAPLHIYGASNTTPILAFTRSSTHDDWQGGGIGLVDEGGSYKGALTFYTHASSGTKNDSVIERLRIRSNGNVVINNSTGSVLEMTRTSTNTSGLCGKVVFGNTDWDSSMASVQAYQDGGNDNASLRFYTQASAAGGEQERLRILSDGGTKLTRRTVGGQESIGNVNDTWWKIGTWSGTGVDAAARATITVLGANTHNSGNPAGGETKIYLSITGSAVYASFYSHTDHHQGVIGVAHKYDSSASSCEIWVKYSAGYSSTSSFADVTNGFFTGASVNTGSSSTPSGATLATSKFVVRTSNGTSSDERLRIDSSGRLIVGGGTDPAESTIVAKGNSTSATSYSVLDMRRGQAATSDGDVLGYIRFSDTNISSSNNNYGLIFGACDGASSGQGDNPGRLVFSTTADGASGPTERLRIQSDGTVKIKEKLVILNGGAFSETAPQGLSIRNAGIYLEQGNDITWNNGDNSISGESGYHLSFKTYDNVNANATKQRFKVEGGQWSRLFGRNRFDQEMPLVNTTGSIAHPDITTNSKSNLGTGWYTIAVNGGNRATGRFSVIDRAGSRHSSCTFYASHHYGGAREQNAINVMHAGGRHSGNPVQGLRIKAAGTYDGCLLQVYIGDSSNAVMATLDGANFNTNGWVMKDWIADGTDPGGVGNFSSVNSGGEAAYAQLGQINGGGMSCDGNFIPAFDNSYSNLGTSNRRWVRVYAGDSTINTSDENLKQDITTLTTAEMNAAKRLSKLFVTYKWKKSVSEKGDKARTHTGIIAQRVKAEMVAAGLDPTKYSFYCEDDKYTMPDGTEVNLEDENITDAEVVSDGHVPSYVQPAGSTKSTVYSICYTELLAFIAAYNEQRFTSIEARLAALESS